MAAPMTGFHQIRKDLTKDIAACLETGSIDGLVAVFPKIDASEPEKKNVVDQCFKDALKQQIHDKAEADVYINTVQLGLNAAKNDMSLTSTPFVMLMDAFDTLTLDVCQQVFVFVEENVTTWKSTQLYNAGKNYLLRMCNDLLRRLSKSQNTVFCGRIQLFLAQLFPLDEKSGLNLTSQFNLENVTMYSHSAEDSILSKDDKKLKDGEEPMEEGEMSDLERSIPIDYNLYKKFWSLQDYFRKPTQCYEKVAWLTFTKNAKECLQTFQSSKLDDLKLSKKKQSKQLQEKQNKSTKHQAYFAKYLTSEKLLDLQLSDSNFRRYVLVQFLILFQYLNAQVKFKSAALTLSDDQQTWIKENTEKIYQLLKETPPDGDKFAANIQHVFKREENWNTWKNEGCPSFVKNPPSEADVKKLQRPKKRSIGDDLKASGGKIIKMGSAELTRLWNLQPDNMEACKSEKRLFLPSLETFFADAIEQCDPEAMVEDEYKLVRKQNYAWKSIRLLARKSPHFFSSASAMLKALPTYLEGILAKMAKEMPGFQEAASNGAPGVKAEDEGNIEDIAPEDNDIQQEETAVKEEASEKVTEELAQKIAERLGTDWKPLATELNIAEENLDSLSKDSPDVKNRCIDCISLWIELEGERATRSALFSALKEIGQVAIATEILGDMDT